MDQYVKLCPNCGKNNYRQESENAFTGDTGFFICNECNFSAKQFPEVSLGDVMQVKEKIHTASPPKIKVVKLGVIPSILLLIVGIIVLSFSVLAFVILFGLYFTYKTVKVAVKRK